MPNGFGRFSLPNLLGKYSLPAVMGRLFHRDFNPGPVGRQQFPTSPSFNVGNVQTGGSLFNPGVNYGTNGWIGPQQTTNYGSPFAPTTGQGLDAVGQDYGAFTPNLGAFTSAPSGNVGTSNSIGGNGWATATGMEASGLLGHFMPRGDEQGNISRLVNR